MKTRMGYSKISSYIINRIHNDKNCVMAIVGETGSGKSLSAISLAEEISDRQGVPFGIDHIAFTSLEFMKLLKKEMPKGSCIVFDECGVAWQSRNFMSYINKALSYALQTVRWKNHVIIMTVPDMSFIDVQGRKLLHMFCITERIIKNRNVARLKPYLISIQYRTGKIYRVTPKIVVDGGFERKIRRIDVHLPSKDLMDKYQLKKQKYTDDLYEDTLNQMKRGRDSGLATLSTSHRTVYELDRAKIPSKKIAEIMQISVGRIYHLRKENKDAGFDPNSPNSSF